eukprot:6953376-Alexandrium_andersonii.AAC.1
MRRDGSTEAAQPDHANRNGKGTARAHCRRAAAAEASAKRPHKRGRRRARAPQTTGGRPHQRRRG